MTRSNGLHTFSLLFIKQFSYCAWKFFIKAARIVDELLTFIIISLIFYGCLLVIQIVCHFQGYCFFVLLWSVSLIKHFFFNAPLLNSDNSQNTKRITNALEIIWKNYNQLFYILYFTFIYISYDINSKKIAKRLLVIIHLSEIMNLRNVRLLSILFYAEWHFLSKQ